jgi:hypothetical protein
LADLPLSANCNLRDNAQVMETSAPIPSELLQKCLHWVTEVHNRVGFGNLPTRITKAPNIAALEDLSIARTMMNSARASSKLRVANWVAGLAIIGLAYAVSPWILLAMFLVAIADRYLKRGERESWEFLAAIFLALEMLVNDFAGWGTAYPDARNYALRLLQLNLIGSDWLSFYVPTEDPSVIRLLAPEI